MQNLVRHCLGFWRSDELRQAALTGPLLSLDTAFFVRELRAAFDGDPAQDNRRRSDAADRQRGESSPGPRRGSTARSPPSRSRSPDQDSQRSGSIDQLDAPSRWRNSTPEPLGGCGAGWSAADTDALRRSLSAFLAEQPWALLCRRLLHTLPDADLLDFGRGLIKPEHDSCGAVAVGLLFGNVRWRRVEDLLLAAALADHGRQLWRLVAEDTEDRDVRHRGRPSCVACPAATHPTLPVVV